MKIRARNYLAALVLLAACGLGVWGLLTPVAEDVAQAAAPAVKGVNFGEPARVGQSREVRRESVPPFDNGRLPVTGPVSPFKPLISSSLGGPVFGTNYRANTDTQSPNLAQQEPSIAVNPTNPLNMVVAAKDERQGTNTKHVYIYSSTDGGVTWINQRFPYRVTVPPSSSDPVVNFSDDGICYVTALIVGGGSTAGVQVARSTDGGITFSTGAQAVANGGADKEWTWIDNFPSSPYYHRMYVAWRNFGGGAAITLNYSTDRGATWSPEVAVSESAYQFPMPVVLPNGDVIVTYLLSFGTLGYARSTDGGASFAAAQKVAFITDP
ncbi:MAG TPA: sialidase family protein, partial [Chloroflexia bacterium]|nr:sialidase family protein [Chloroflexia bacterium]